MAQDARGRLEGQTALVTGGASGIGRGICERFAAEGARVVVADINEAGARAVADELGHGAIAVAVDVTDEDSVAAMIATAAGAGGDGGAAGLDAVVANAGAGGFSLIVDHPLDEWRRVTELCQTGVFLTIKHAGRRFREQGHGGTITCIASLNAIQPSAGMAAYCSAKAAVAMLAQVAAMELGPHGVRVNTIAPGLIETPATAAFFAVPGVVDEFVENTTIARFGQPEDVAAMAAFLASDDAKFVSAGFFSVDGGARTKRYPDLPARIAEAMGEAPS